MLNKNMNLKDWIVLSTLVSLFVVHRVLLICYISTAKFSHLTIFICCLIFLSLSLVINPVMLMIYSIGSTRYTCRRYFLNLLWTFPLIFLSVDFFLLVHPKLMRLMMKTLGVNDIREVLYSVIRIFYGNALSSGIFDAFCQVILIWNNVQNIGEASILSIMVISTCILVAIVVFNPKLRNSLDVILTYVQVYSDLRPLTERLMKPRVFKYNLRFQGANCSICLEDYAEEQTLASVPTCEHVFHEVCLKKWLDTREMCPLCRNEQV